MNEEIERLQEISILTWPPKMIFNQKGWKIRISEGITKRANSVSPMFYTGKNLSEDISKVESFFQENNLSSIFQLPDYFEPAELKETLLSLNYEIIDETIVMIADLDKLILPVISEKFEFHCLDNELDRWIESLKGIYKGKTSRIEGMREIISRITKSNVGYFIADDHGKTVAVGLAVLEESHMAIYSMYTHPDYRRKGIAQSILIKMIEWGEINLVDSVFLQVESVNTVAINLYEKIGFKEKYRYRYLVKEL